MLSLLDTALDRTILPGYTKLGYRLRRLGWNALAPDGMAGRVVVITGANAGLGYAAASGFARLGAEVRLVARNPDRGEQARERVIAATGNPAVEVICADLSELTSVQALARRLQEEPIDVLVHNAGVMTDRRRVSAEGIELTLATNVIGPFLLTSLLEGHLRAGAPARVVTVSSGGMYAQRLDLANLGGEQGEFSGSAVYARTKRAQVILSEMWAERFAGSGVVVHAMHPGWADTEGVRSSMPRFHTLMGPLLRSPDEGADTIVWLGAAREPGESTGRFWHDRRPRPTHLLPRTRESPPEREELWARCVALSER